MNSISHASLEELKKALLASLPKAVAAVWVGRLNFQGHSIGEKEFSQLTDELGLVGGIARAVNSVPHIISPPGCSTLQISSTWDDDLRSGKPLRVALEAVGSINKWAETDASGNMAIEMSEPDAVPTLLSKAFKDLPEFKGLIGHHLSASSESVDVAYARGVASSEETSGPVLNAMIRECQEQSELLVDVQVKAREGLGTATDAAWRDRMQVLLDVLRQLISIQVTRIKLLREAKDAPASGASSAGSLRVSASSGLPAKAFKNLLQPIRRASSSALASIAEKAERRRSSANTPLTENMIEQMQKEGALPPSIVSPHVSGSSTPFNKDSEEDSDRSSLEPTHPSTTPDEGTLAVPPPMSLGAADGKKSTRRKAARRKGGARGSAILSSSSGGSNISEGGGGDQASQGSSGSGSLTEADLVAPTIDDVFSTLYEQLKVAQAALQAREAQVKLREGRLRAKKRSLVKRQNAATAKLEEMRKFLDEREAALAAREHAYEVRMRKVTRLKKKEHMRALIEEFSANPNVGVIPLQRAVRVLLARRSLRNSARMILSSELFRDARCRKGALMEIFSSEAEHVSRLEQLFTYRKAAREFFATAKILPQIEKVFVGLDHVLEAAKVLLIDLNVRKSEWPSNTRVADVFQSWVGKHLPSYKPFINGYDAAVAALQDLRTKKPYLEWEAQMSARGFPPLDSLLIVPIQRLPRYRLLLESLIGFTDESHVDLKALHVALDMVSKAVSSVNAGKAVAEKMQVLLSLDEQIYGLPQETPVVIPDRTLIHRGTLGDAMDPRAPLKHFLLFNDALFELLPRKRIGGLLAGKKGLEEYDFSRALLFSPSSLELREIPPSVMRNGFSLKNTEGEWQDLQLFAASPQELRSWILAIKGMRRLERPVVLCGNCGTPGIHGADRCHVCQHLLLEKSADI